MANPHVGLKFAHDRLLKPLLERRVAGQPRTLDEVAGLLGVNASAIGRWENGLRMPTPAHLRALCEALDVGAYCSLPPRAGALLRHLRLRRFLTK